LVWLVLTPAFAFLAAYIIYAPVTDIWSRYLDGRMVRSGRPSSHRIALTFDDGPDPEYTPRVLGILAAASVPAAFFLVGEKAERNHDIVRQIDAGNHLIGTHTYRHRHAYLITPGQARREVRQAIAVIADIVSPPFWFRPPWGAFNLSIRLTAAGAGQHIALWSVNGADWKQDRTADDIVAAVTRRLRPGAIVVLHDSGGAAGAPEQTVAALPDIIDWAKENGYIWERLDDLVGGSLSAVNQ